MTGPISRNRLLGSPAEAASWPGAHRNTVMALAAALEIITPGLLRHPGSRELAELRQAVAVRLMEQRQLSDPFGFLVYAELAGAEFPRSGSASVPAGPAGTGPVDTSAVSPRIPPAGFPAHPRKQGTCLLTPLIRPNRRSAIPGKGT